MKKHKHRAMPEATDAYDKSPRRSSANIDLGDNLKLPALTMGKKVTIEITGKLTRMSDESYSKGFAMEITSLEVDSMGEDMGHSKRSRMMDLDDDY